jgi:hypothetical protein
MTGAPCRSISCLLKSRPPPIIRRLVRLPPKYGYNPPFYRFGNKHVDIIPKTGIVGDVKQVKTWPPLQHDTDRRGQDRRVREAPATSAGSIPGLEKRGIGRHLDETTGHKEQISVGGYPAEQPRNF